MLIVCGKPMEPFTVTTATPVRFRSQFIHAMRAPSQSFWPRNSPGSWPSHFRSVRLNSSSRPRPICLSTNYSPTPTLFGQGGCDFWTAARLFIPDSFLKGNAARSFLERFKALGILSVILLMIFLGRIKFRRRQNFGHNRFVEFPRAREFLFGGLGDFLFLLGAVKDRSAITRADVGELAIRLRRIDLPPINVH